VLGILCSRSPWPREVVPFSKHTVHSVRDSTFTAAIGRNQPLRRRRRRLTEIESYRDAAPFFRADRSAISRLFGSRDGKPTYLASLVIDSASTRMSDVRMSRAIAVITPCELHDPLTTLVIISDPRLAPLTSEYTATCPPAVSILDTVVREQWRAIITRGRVDAGTTGRYHSVFRHDPVWWKTWHDERSHAAEVREIRGRRRVGTLCYELIGARERAPSLSLSPLSPPRDHDDVRRTYLITVRMCDLSSLWIWTEWRARSYLTGRTGDTATLTGAPYNGRPVNLSPSHPLCPSRFGTRAPR